MYTRQLILLCVVTCVQVTFATSISSKYGATQECIKNAVMLENSTSEYDGYSSMCYTYCNLLEDYKIEKDGSPIINMIPPERRASIIACDNIYKNMSTGACSRAQHLTMCFSNAIRTEQFAHSQACISHQKKAVTTRSQGGRPYKSVPLTCYNRCISIKKGQFNDKNEIIAARFVEVVPKSIIDVEEVAKECNGLYTNETDACKLVSLRKACFIQKTVGVMGRYINMLNNYMM